jgi:hypothetical protein
LGGKLVANALEDVMPKVVASALVGLGSGAISGAATSAVGYGMSCGASGDGCSLSGAASAIGSGALWGGLIGGVVGGALSGGGSGEAATADGEAGAGAAADHAPAESEPAAGKSEDESPSCPTKGSPRHSFVGSTGVLMADGSSRSIDQVKVGDQVANSVPGEATLQSHTVQKVIVTQTDRDFVDLTVKKLAVKLGQAAAGLALAAAAVVGAATPASAATSTLTTTYHHPFYDLTQAAFVDAVDLHPGDQLQTADGATAEVTTVRPYHQTETTYDLTINGLHTYYVLAGTAPVLVHNCGGQTLYRSDTRDPSEIFANGFESRGDNMDVLEHASGWSRDSGYVATTTSERVAINRGGNVYEVRADGVDVNKEFPGNPFSHEREVAVPRRIAPECIVSCRLPDGTRVMNPNYGGGR